MTSGHLAWRFGKFWPLLANNLTSHWATNESSRTCRGSTKQRADPETGSASPPRSNVLAKCETWWTSAGNATKASDLRSEKFTFSFRGRTLDTTPVVIWKALTSRSGTFVKIWRARRTVTTTTISTPMLTTIYNETFFVWNLSYLDKSWKQFWLDNKLLFLKSKANKIALKYSQILETLKKNKISAKVNVKQQQQSNAKNRWSFFCSQTILIIFRCLGWFVAKGNAILPVICSFYYSDKKRKAKCSSCNWKQKFYEKSLLKFFL